MATPTPARACEFCGKPLIGGRADRRFCDANHRARAHQRRRRPRLRVVEDFPPVDDQELDADELLQANLIGVVIREAQAGSWQAARWLLMTRWPERYAP